MKKLEIKTVEYYGMDLDIPTRMSYVATGSNGQVYAFENQPSLINQARAWWKPNGNYVQLDGCINEDCDWTDSLRYYPEQKAEQEVTAKGDEQNGTCREFYRGVWMDVPMWAEYLAVDQGGSVYAYKDKPVKAFQVWAVVGDQMFKKVGWVENTKDWQNSLVRLIPKKKDAGLRKGVYQGVRFQVPEEFSYLAVDQNGMIYAYDRKPTLAGNQWLVNSDGRVKYIGFVEQTGRWQNSLINLTEEIPGKSANVDCVENEEKETDMDETLENTVDRLEEQRPEYEMRQIIYRGKKINIPVGYNYVAADQDGTVYAYDNPPEINEVHGEWAVRQGWQYKTDTTINDKMNWKASLRYYSSANRVDEFTELSSECKSEGKFNSAQPQYEREEQKTYNHLIKKLLFAFQAMQWFCTSNGAVHIIAVDRNYQEHTLRFDVRDWMESGCTQEHTFEELNQRIEEFIDKAKAQN